MKRAIAIAIPITACLLFSFFNIYEMKKNDKHYTEHRAEAQRIIDKRKAKSERQKQLTPLLNIPLEHPPEHATNKPIFKDSTANMTDHSTPPEINIHTYRYENGIYKGMTYPEAYVAWKKKHNKLWEELLPRGDKAAELASAMIDSADTKLSLILSIFKSMSPEELKLVKSDTLKDYPEKADEIESFFNDVANKGTTKSLEEIAKDYEFILESDKTLEISRKQNWNEIDKINKELEQVEKEKPKPPIFQ